jgi:hypothetical protein
LVEEAETWFNFLPETAQTDFSQLQIAFRQQYRGTQNERLNQLAHLRQRIQRATEPLRVFLVDIGSKLKAIGYNRELWLGLIFRALKPELQSAIACFGKEEIRSFDDLLDKAERM